MLGVILCAYLIRGITGFGSGLISVPILALFYPLKFVVPVIMTLDFAASFILGGMDKKKTAWSEIGLLLPFGLIGALFGVYVLIEFPSRPILMALALFTIFFGMRNVLGIQPVGAISRMWALPAGIVGSGAGALFGTSGPPYIIYLTHRLQDKTTVRATFSWLFVLDGGFRLALFMIAGLLLREDTLSAIGLGLIPMLLGLYIGNRVHINITREYLLKIVGVLLLITGSTLVWKVLS